MNANLQELPADLTEEVLETLLSGTDVRVERIVSDGHHSPDGFWYDQEQSEWVTILQGYAVLEFDRKEDRLVSLATGDYVNIPAHVRHRVAETCDSCPTVWLAIHYTAT